MIVWSADLDLWLGKGGKEKERLGSHCLHPDLDIDFSIYPPSSRSVTLGYVFNTWPFRDIQHSSHS